MSKQEDYKFLCQTASECRDCPNVYHELTYLNDKNGDINSPLMFIGEAPGFVRNPNQRLKAFFGNQSGWNFEHLLKTIGISRDSVFVTNALVHTPVRGSKRKYDDDYGYLEIRPPSPDEIKKCGKFLRMQIELVNPTVICTLGRAALDSCQEVLPDFPPLRLYYHAARPFAWKERVIYPLYHTSPNVTASIRSLSKMEEDFKGLKAVMETLKVQI